jgi:hypothetical protein
MGKADEVLWLVQIIDQSHFRQRPAETECLRKPWADINRATGFAPQLEFLTYVSAFVVRYRRTKRPSSIRHTNQILVDKSIPRKCSHFPGGPPLSLQVHPSSPEVRQRQGFEEPVGLYPRTRVVRREPVWGMIVWRQVVSHSSPTTKSNHARSLTYNLSCPTLADDDIEENRGKRTMMERIQNTKQSHEGESWVIMLGLMREGEEQRADRNCSWFSNSQHFTRQQNLISPSNNQLAGLSYQTQIKRVSKSRNADCVYGLLHSEADVKLCPVWRKSRNNSFIVDKQKKWIATHSRVSWNLGGEDDGM